MAYSAGSPPTTGVSAEYSIETPPPPTISFPRPTATHRPPPHTTSLTAEVMDAVLFVLDDDKYVSSQTNPFRSFEYIIVLTVPSPTATQYIPFHEMRFTRYNFVSVFATAVHVRRSVDHAIEAVFASLVGDPSPPTIQTEPFHITE
jgi:hypothetical protein